MNNPIIAQAVFTVYHVGNSTEIEYSWVEPGKGLEKILGVTFNYATRSFNRSIIRRGRDQREKRITFEKSGRLESTEHKKEYAGLISMQRMTDIPYILGFGPKADFQSVQDLLAAEKDGRKVENVVQPENFAHYKVRAHGHDARGTLRDIVNELAREIGDDPIPTITSEASVWMIKGDDKQYHPCSTPASIPALPAMLLESLRKQKKA